MNINISKLVIKKYEEEDLPKYPVIETKIKSYNFYSHLIDDLSILNQKQDYIDLNIVRTHFNNLGRLSVNQVLKILNDARILFKEEPNNLQISNPSYILGDIHGQYFDLINIINSFDLQKDTLVFLGDYVDRGMFSTETFLYLCLLKIYYKDRIFLLRGNHESVSMTTKYTFKSECLNKYNELVYQEFLKTFNTLPLTAVIMDSIFCVHGGISPNLKKISEINLINRFTDIKKNKIMKDLLWSDPHSDYENSEEYFIDNSTRKCSYFYTWKSVSEFLDQNNLKFICRGHEIKEEGYELYKDFKGYPSMITLFSAPNYCNEFKNKGAFLYFDGINVDIKTFEGVKQPDLLLNNMDGINWTFPFISEKISEFYSGLLQLLNQSSEETDEILLQKELRKSKNLQLSMLLVRSERENLSQILNDKPEIYLNMIKMNKIDKSFLDVKDSQYFIEQESDKNIKRKGISMDIPESLIPNITEELSKMSIDKLLKKSSVKVDQKTDKGELFTSETTRDKRNSCTGWII